MGPYTPTLLSLLTKSGRLTLPTLAKEAAPPPSYRNKVAVTRGGSHRCGARPQVQEGGRARARVADNAWAGRRCR